MSVQAVALLVGLVNLVQAGTLFGQFLIAKARGDSPWWAWSMALVGAGFVLVLFQTATPWWGLATIAANLLFGAGLLSLNVGIWSFLGVPVPWKILGLAALALSAWFVLFTLIFSSLFMRALGISFFDFVFSSLAAFSFLKGRNLAVRKLLIFLAWVTGANALYFLIRLGLFFFLDKPFVSLFYETQTLTYFITLALTTLMTMGYILMVNLRLSEDAKSAQENFERIFDAHPDAVMITELETGVYVKINEAMKALTGYTAQEALGKSTLELRLWHDLSDREAMVRQIRERRVSREQTFTFRKKNGKTFTGSMSSTLIRLDEKPYILSVVKDISERVQLEKELFTLATTDALTGLANRRRFLDLGEQELKRAVRRHLPLTLAQFDIDHFKNINDNLGHAAGDSALVLLAKECRACIREIDFVARLGGDEFVILFPETTAEQSLVVLNRIREKLRESLFSISVGVCQLDVNIDSLDDLLERSDKALYQAKNGGRDQIVVFNVQDQVQPELLQIGWNAAWNSGDDTIDTEHRELLQLVSKLVNRAFLKTNTPDFLQEFDFVLGKLKKHFDDEEKILNELGYPGAEAHALIHQDLMTKANTLRDRTTQGKAPARDFFDFLFVKVMREHVLSADKKYFSWTQVRN
ncbi:MAG: diguanylate cyclase [Spirochaetales bacterium]|nr:diguanylate cyclase [Spirochaetales bacterium]